MVNKFQNWLNNTGDKIKTSVKISRETPFFYLSLILIVVLAVLVRLSPVIMGTFLIKEFDPWVQYTSAKYIVENGWFEWFHYHDYKMWYPEGTKRYELRPGLPFTAALFYYIAVGLGLPVTLYDVCFYFPAIMGGFTVLAMYFLGKEVYDEKAGLLAAFFLAFSPGHMQRTVAGFFDNETIGVFGILLILLFYIKAVKSGKASHGLLAGLSMGYLGLSWGGLSFPFLLIPLLTAILILVDKYNSRIIMAYALTMGPGLLLYSISPTFKWEGGIKSMEFGVPLVFFAFLILYHLLYLQKGSASQIYENAILFIKIAAIPVGITLAIIFWKKPEWIPFGLGGRMGSILNPSIRENIALVASVGEHMPSPWSVFYFNTLIPLLLVVPGIYFALKRAETEDFLMVIFVVVLFYFTGSMVRIILVLAPAVALVGGYGLASILKHYGTLMKKETMVSRRRKRQLKRTVSRPEGFVTYILIGVLLFVQANHAIRVSVVQLPYSELVIGGVYHDWEETLTWMKYNLDPEDVIVSWWDYGYWTTQIGNVTSVNDNGTWNMTRIGLTGMAMMQTNERYSAEIFRNLKADYVMVYFGHLINGLGGDEGKWPWMLRICNDNTELYKNWSLEKDNWYGDNRQVNTVWDEAEFINKSSGLYEDKWFDSQIVKLMFYEAPTTLSSARTQTEAYFAAQIEGSSQYNTRARTTDDGELWSSKIPNNGQYNFQFFQKEYFSTNRLVKIFKVDYTALDSSFEVKNPTVNLEGFGWADVKNTGTMNVSINDLRLNNVKYNFTVELPNQQIAPGQTRKIWFDTNENNKIWKLGDTYNLTLSVAVNKNDGTSFQFSNSSNSKQVVAAVKPVLKIDRDGSKLEKIDAQTKASIKVTNIGTVPTVLKEININDEIKNSSNVDIFNDATGNFLLIPGQSEVFNCETSATAPIELNWEGFVGIMTPEGFVEATILPYNIPDFRMKIVTDDLAIRPEDRYLFNYNTYKVREPEKGRYFMNDDSESFLLENGTLILKVQNTGSKVFGFRSLYVNDTAIDFEVIDGNYFPKPGETRTIRATVDQVYRNKPTFVAITGEYDGACASDTIYFIPRNESSMITIITDDNSMTSGFANETLRLVVKNVGSNPIILTELIVNSTTPIVLDTSHIRNGSLNLNPRDVAVLNVNITSTGLKFNYSDIMDVKITTNLALVEASAELSARLPGIAQAFIIHPWNKTVFGATYSNTKITDNFGADNQVHILIQMGWNNTATLDGVYIKNASTDFIYIPFSQLRFYDNNNQDVLDRIMIGDTTDVFRNYYIDFKAIAAGLVLTVGEWITVKLVAKEGWYGESLIQVVD